MVLTSSQNEAERLASDLLGLLGEEKVYLFLGDDNPLAEFVFASQERIFSRLEALDFSLAPEKEGNRYCQCKWVVVCSYLISKDCQLYDSIFSLLEQGTKSDRIERYPTGPWAIKGFHRVSQQGSLVFEGIL